jgi:biotin synthase
MAPNFREEYMGEVNVMIGKILSGQILKKADVMSFIKRPLDELCALANTMRDAYSLNAFDFCSIINAKSGACPEDCQFCAQSVRYGTNVRHYNLLENETIVQSAFDCSRKGIKRFSIVTSGKRLSDNEIDRIGMVVRDIRRKTKIGVCISIGLATEKQYMLLKEAGVTRVHNNLETSRHYFPAICSTHTYDDKLKTIEAAKKCGLDICCGGIIGLGETIEDRIDLALEIRKIGAISIPINILDPIPGTPFEKKTILCEKEIQKTIAIMRLINPRCDIRLAGGRKLLADRGKKCFESGANAVITGNMLTTTGISIEDDKKMVRELGFNM